MNNHLIVGLGGTGGKTIREFRKGLMNQYRTLQPDGIHLEYLYIDSDESDMGATDKKWRTLGHNVQLARFNQLPIGTADLASIIANPNAYPGVKGWIGDRSFWSGVLTTQSGATILGGQKRRLGRFLFSQQSEEFVTRIKTIAQDLQKRSAEIPVTFHVCCGLAGGTGSGCVVDVITQIRRVYEDSKNFPIIVYALLPDRTPANGWDTGNYHANGYAALLELNALHVGAWKPHDVTGQLGDKRIALTDAFNTCYLFSNQNENNTFLNVETEVPQVISSFLLTAILTAPREHLDTFRRVVTGENRTESVTPEPRPDGSGHERSRKFGIFGIKVLAYPEEEIREYLTYSFARQASLQLLSNNWRDLAGFVEEPRPQDFTEFVRRPETQERWKFSVDHLTLSRGILDGEIADQRWRPIATFWSALGPQWLTAITANEVTRTKWMHELKAKFDEMFTVGYRTQGVREFYRGKLKAKREHAENIARTIERELFDGWLTGDRSLGDVTKLLTALRGFLDDLGERLERFEADDRAKIESTDQRIAANDTEWAKCGPLARAINKDKNVLNVQTTLLQEKYGALTRVEGLQFGRALLVDLVAWLEDLSNDVASARKTIDEALAISTRHVNTRCAQTVDYDLNKLVVTFYDTAKVRSLSSTLEQDRDEQALQTNAVRAAIKEKVAAGEQGTFARFNERLRVDALVQLLEDVCERQVDISHTNLVSSGKIREKHFDVNIVGKLHERFGGRPDELTEFVHDLMAKAGRYGTFNRSELSQTGKGIKTGDAPADFAVLLPLSPDHREFRELLAERFKGASARIPVQIYENSRRNEITLVSVSAGFPLRFLDDVRFLRDRYERRLDSAERARIEVHLEGDGSQHPSLFLPKPEETEREMLEYLLLADVLGVVTSRSRGSTGRTRLVQVLYDEDGDERDSIDLGGDVFDAAKQATHDVAFGLRKLVDEKLVSREFRSEERRVALRKALSERVRVMRDALDAHDGDLRDQLNAALQGAKIRLQAEGAV